MTQLATPTMRMHTDVGYACIVCAEASRSQDDVERFATGEHDQRRYGRFEAIDIACIPAPFRIAQLDATPCACATRPDRTHWFLIAYR